MLRIWKLIACSIAASLALFASAMAQNLEVKRYNPSEWTKGRFSEIVTVNGPGKTIYLAGIGAEEENAPTGASAPIRHHGDPYEQCKYAYDKIKRALAANGAQLSDVVKITTYMTDLRYRLDMGKCIGASWGGVVFPVHTLIGVAALAFPEMIVEVDVTAIVQGK